MTFSVLLTTIPHHPGWSLAYDWLWKKIYWMDAWLFYIESSLGTVLPTGLINLVSRELRLFFHQPRALWPFSKTTSSGTLWAQGGLDKHTDSDDKYIFLFAFVSLLCFLHHFLRLLEFCIHQLLLQFSVFKYFVQMLRKKEVHISSMICHWCWKM